MQNFQVNDLVSWSDGTVKQYGRIEAVLSKAVRIETEWGETVRVPLSRLVLIPPILLGWEECRALARLEAEAVERYDGCLLKNLVNRDGYSLSVEDLLASLPRLPLDRWDEEKLCDWGTFFSDILEGQTDPDKGQFYTEKDALLSMLDGIYHCRLGFNGERIPDALEVGRLFCICI